MKKHFWIILAIVLVLLMLIPIRKVAQNGNVSEILVSKSTGEAAIGGPFELVNQEGETVTDQTYAGKLKLVFFGFTFCPDICPTDLMLLTNVMNSLSENQATQVVPLFISVDPERDTVSQMKEYLANFHPAMQGLTGTREQVDTAIKAYRVYAKKVQEPNMTEYTMDHSAYIYLISRDGKYITHFQHNEKPDAIIAAIETHLRK